MQAAAYAVMIEGSNPHGLKCDDYGWFYPEYFMTWLIALVDLNC